MEKEMDYRDGIHRIVDRIADKKLLKLIYNLINWYYAAA